MRTALEEIDRAGEFSNRLQDLVFQRRPLPIIRDGHGDPLLLALWSVGFDLFRGILTVMRDKFYSGGFALLRPLVETQLRAHLVVRNAGDDVERIRNDTYNVNFETIGAEIDKFFLMEGYMQAFLRRYVKLLHSFTHSGLAQLVRHFDGDGVGARYDEEEIIEIVLRGAESVFFLNNIVTRYFNLEDEWKRTTKLLVEWNRPH